MLRLQLIIRETLFADVSDTQFKVCSKNAMDTENNYTKAIVADFIY